MATKEEPVSPDEVGPQGFKSNPALFAIALSDHSGFDALSARTMTPPPQYTRHEQPRLTLLIPEQVDEDEQSTSSPSVESPFGMDHTHSIETSPVGTSPTMSSPIATSTVKYSESKLFSKVKAEVKRRGKGLKSKLRSSTWSPKTGSSSSTPQNCSSASLPPLGDGIISTNNGQLLNSTAINESFSVVQELDGRQINATLDANSRHTEYQDRRPSSGILSEIAGPYHRFRRNESVSSIVPTPKRGLSLARPEGGSAMNADINYVELTGRLRSIQNPNIHSDQVAAISPGSFTSPVAVSPVVPLSLMRSNAITDRISSILDPVSPMSPLARSPSPPPSTPTFDSRLAFLPRLKVTQPRDSGSQRDIETVVPGTLGPWNLPRRQFAELDCGKEVVSLTASAEEIAGGWYTSPNSSPNLHAQQAYPIPCTTVDYAAHAPELLEHASYPSLHHMRQPYPLAKYPSPKPAHIERPFRSRSPFAAMTGSLWEALLAGLVNSTDFLRERYGPEPPVPEGHVRVRWRCTCGEHLFDDYIENTPGAAAELEAYLNRAPNQWPNSPPSSDPSSAGGSVFSAGNNTSPLSAVTSWSSRGSNSPTLWDQRANLQQPARVASSNLYSLGLKSFIEPLWLYTCVNEGKWTTKMRHVDVNNSRMSSDKDLALALRKLYSKVNRRWYRLFKLRGLVSIKFVQFELHRNGFADISKTPALPNLQTIDGCTYEFTSHDVTPPVGSSYLMHLVKHPYDYDDELIAYLRTPKRRIRLENGTGWGLQLVEGFLAERVWAAILALAVLGSAVFAGVWATRGSKSDIQGAFGVAGWIVAIAGLAGAWAQAVFD